MVNHPAMGNYGWGLPIQASSFAAEIDRGIWIIHIAMVLIFVVWGVFFTYLLIKFRARPGARASRAEHVSHKASLAPDLLVLTFEILLVVFYAVPSWSRIKMNFPAEAESTVVEILGEQFNWSARYPGPDGKFGRTAPELVDFANPFGIDAGDPAGADDVVAVNEIRFPVGKPVLARLTSKDVVHSFFIPEFRIKQDATPGLVVPVWFTPTRVGDYEITCAQLCGVGHAIMRADVKVESPEAFDAWLAKKAGAAQEQAEPVEVW